jgi:hypothetical protein
MTKALTRNKPATPKRILHRVGSYGNLYPKQMNDAAATLIKSSQPLGRLAIFLGEEATSQSTLLTELGQLTTGAGEPLVVDVIAGADNGELVSEEGLVIARDGLCLVRKYIPRRDEACYPVIEAIGKGARVDLSTELAPPNNNRGSKPPRRTSY